jgi:hypothetical protein
MEMKQKRRALLFLKLKKNIASVLDKRMANIEALESVLFKIENIHSEAEVKPTRNVLWHRALNSPA